MSRLRVADDVLVQEQDGDAFLLHVVSGRYFGLNRAGVVIWEAIAAGAEPEGAVAARWPDLPPDQRKRDVETLVAALEHAGLVVRDA